MRDFEKGEMSQGLLVFLGAFLDWQKQAFVLFWLEKRSEEKRRGTRWTGDPGPRLSKVRAHKK
jgi:hypothetical protein